MPPKAANKGGKGGRPPAASRSQDASQAQQLRDSVLPQDLNDELSFEDQSTPKDGVIPPTKAAQPAPKQASRQPKRTRAAAANTSEPQPTPRRTGRASQTTRTTARDDELADEATETPGSAKVGQRRTGRVDGGLAPAAPETTTSPDLKRKRGRPLKADQPEASSVAEETEPPAKRKRGRPSLQKATDTSDASLKESSTRANKGKRKGPAASGEDQAVEAEAEPPAKKPRRRKPPADEPAPEPPRPRGRPRTSTTAAPESKSKAAERRPSPPKRPRPAKNTPADSAPAASSAPRLPDIAEAGTPAPPVVKARRLGDKPTTISESVISETWSPLDRPSITIATSHLDLASRPVLQRLTTNVKRRDHAADILRKVSGIIARRLRSFPLPPALAHKPPRRAGRKPRGARPADPRDDELSHEHVLGTVKALQRSLDTLLDSRRLLEAERDRQQASLEKEYAELDRLEGNARSEVRGLREQLRKAHPLVPEAARQGGNAHEDPGVRPVVDDAPGGALFRDMDDVQLPGLETQLSSHMQSLRTNLGQVDGVVPEILQSRAALRHVLANHLDLEQLEHVVLG